MNTDVSNEVVDPNCIPLNISDERVMRASLAAALEASRAELDRSLIDLQTAGPVGASSPQLEAVGAQLAVIQQLQFSLSSGVSGAAFQDLRTKAFTAMSASMVLVSDARAAASATTTQTAEAALHLASEAARREVTSFVEDFYEKKIFDPFLRFGSAEDEAAYREREEKRKREIKEAMAEGTPAGTLKANLLSREQMLDAGAHGADASPDYAPMLAQRGDSIERLASAIDRAAAQAPNEVDAALGDTPAPTTPASDPVAAAVGLLASGVALGEGDGGHGLTAKDAPKTTSPARK